MPTQDPFKAPRHHMLQGQLQPANVHDERILDAFAEVRRELFVPEGLAGAAYVDEDIQVAPGRYLLAPVVLGRMLQEANIASGSTVLDVGCATGYSTAILSKLAKRVVAVEGQMELAEQARQLLNKHKAKNAEVVTGPMAAGYPSAGPFDVILINGGVQVIPQALTDQLAEGGRMMLVRHVASRPGSPSGLGQAMLCVKREGRLLSRESFDALVPLLVGFEAKMDFVF